jgi:Arc/MetJ family transcription regulator
MPRVEDLGPAEVMEVLRRLSKRRDAVGEAMRAEVVSVATQVSPDGITAQVHADLAALTVEDLWDRSGQTRYGYVDPAEESWVMVEEVVRPHVERIRQLQRWGRRTEACEYCLAVLDGIYTYAHESDSEFKDHAPDDPVEAFGWVYDSWKRGERDGVALAKLERKVVVRFPEWAR